MLFEFKSPRHEVEIIYFIKGHYLIEAEVGWQGYFCLESGDTGTCLGLFHRASGLGKLGGRLGRR